jgi:hypothetical protein
VEVHQQNASSSDVSFDFALMAQVNPENRPPTAGAGEDQTARTGDTVRLTGTYQDDGLPAPPGVVTLEWRQVEGAAAAMLSATNRATVSVTFPAPGRYVFRWTVNDGSLAVSDDVIVTVSADDYSLWREVHFSISELADPSVSGDDADPDGDGLGNRAEFDSGTDPRDLESVLRLGATRGPDGRVRLRIPVVEGRTYTVLARDAAASGAWRTLAHLDPAECDCEAELMDPDPAEHAARFYRVVTPRLP